MKHKGFTIIEIMVVIIILTTILYISIVNIRNSMVTKQIDSSAMGIVNNLRNIKNATDSIYGLEMTINFDNNKMSIAKAQIDGEDVKDPDTGKAVLGNDLWRALGFKFQDNGNISYGVLTSDPSKPAVPFDIYFRYDPDSNIGKFYNSLSEAIDSQNDVVLYVSDG